MQWMKCYFDSANRELIKYFHGFLIFIVFSMIFNSNKFWKLLFCDFDSVYAKCLGN